MRLYLLCYDVVDPGRATNFAKLPSSLHKGHRSKRPPKDPVNAMLSYWYSLYYHLVAARLLMAGFDPALGVLHKAFRSHCALASDFMELFRADINHAVFNLFTQNILKAGDFSRQGGVYLKYNDQIDSIFENSSEVSDAKIEAILQELSQIKSLLRHSVPTAPANNTASPQEDFFAFILSLQEAF